MVVIGLTGGIGCGKTQVSNLFSNYDVPIIDADIISRELVQPQKPALQQIQHYFGKNIINSDGHLNRIALKERIFSDPQQKQQLEAILHPLIFQTIQQRLQKLKNTYIILSIPLLLESQQNYPIQRILVIDCPIEIQIQRVKNRDNLSDKYIQSIIDSQIDRQQRLKLCDDIIDNSTDFVTLAKQVETLHHLYLSLANTQKKRD